MGEKERLRESRQSFDAYYLWDPIVKHIWLEGRLSSIIDKQSEQNIDGSRGYFDAVYADHIYRHLRLAPGLRVLNVGCGVGRDELQMAGLCPGLELVACDISETMIRTCRRNRHPARLVLCAAEHLPLADASVHRILSREVVEHVVDPRGVIREVHRLLAPGGIAVVTTPNGSGLVQWGVNLTGWFANRDVRDVAIPVRQVCRWAEEAGLGVERVVLDGAAYFMMVAWPRWLRWLIPAAARAARALEPLPIIRGLVCDQAKYVLIKSYSAGCAAAPTGASASTGAPARAAVPETAGPPVAIAVRPTSPPQYVESADDRRLREAIRAAEAPRPSGRLCFVRGIFSVFLIPLAYLVLTAVLLPASLVLLGWQLATGRHKVG